MKKQVREYTQEFKEEAVKLVLKSQHLTRTARDLGIPIGTLNSWVRQLKGKPTTFSSSSPSQDVGLLMEENRRLHKELNIVKEEREILKKAAAYFAQHQK
jgi:transposase